MKQITIYAIYEFNEMISKLTSREVVLLVSSSMRILNTFLECYVFYYARQTERYIKLFAKN